jgi:8-oxo-dGTP pyrophosphatase MutT (NUDIX family)
MEKFSSMRPKNEFDESKDKVLFQKDRIKIIEFEDWMMLKENDSAVCIPYLIETNQIVIRREYIPTFKYAEGQEYHVAIVGGMIDPGESPRAAMIRELEEEAGIVLREDYDLEEELKPLFFTKGCVNKVYPYILPLNERDYHEVVPSGDGSDIEKKSNSVKVDIKYLSSINVSDMLVDYMLLKFKEYLNL